MSHQGYGPPAGSGGYSGQQPGSYTPRPGDYSGQQPPGGYQGQQQPRGSPGQQQQGGYPGQQQPRGYPGQQQPRGYPGQQQQGGFPGQQQQGGFPGQQQQGGYPGQQQPRGYPGQQQQGGYPGQQAPGYSQGQPPGQTGPPPGVDASVWQWFITVDRDGSGQITAQELQSALTNTNWSNFNSETCRLMIGIFDKDNNGTIDVREFQQLWLYINQWQQVFNRYDRDKSGNIDVGELYTAYSEMGFRISQAFCQMVVTQFDRQAKKCLRFDDFIQSCVMLRSLTDAFKVRDTNLNGIIQVSYEDFMTMAIANKP